MSSDNQFTALGPTIIGFQTNGSRIQRGAEISGNEVGVSGYCDAGYGVLGTSKTDVGVYGTSESIAGVVGKGTPGVVGQGPGSIKTVDLVVLSSYKAGV